eukprot:198927_1
MRMNRYQTGGYARYGQPPQQQQLNQSRGMSQMGMNQFGGGIGMNKMDMNQMGPEMGGGMSRMGGGAMNNMHQMDGSKQQIGGGYARYGPPQQQRMNQIHATNNLFGAPQQQQFQPASQQRNYADPFGKLNTGQQQPQQSNAFQGNAASLQQPQQQYTQNKQTNNEFEEAMINQLRVFGYNDLLITDALNNVTNKHNINCIIEYIDTKQSRQQQFNDNKKDKLKDSTSALEKKPEEDDANRADPFADLVKEFEHIKIQPKLPNIPAANVEQKQENQSVNGSTEQLYKFLKQHRLEHYFNKFKEHNCGDIRDIEYFVEDEPFIQNEIGIKSTIERRRFIGECKKLKVEMN